MALTAGSRFGAYEVLAAIGAGGMGEVYRARDTQLNRDVALKVLPDAFAFDSNRLARFTREAQVLAALNHPNIGAIYGLEEANGIRALVLELVEGPTLADRIAQGLVPLDEALPIARQIADALEAAHQHGIIHRDLKPANIKVRADGTVKVLDFGLAKAAAPDGAGVPAGDFTDSPTIARPDNMTGIGVLVGTVAYMAPEQARAKAVDKRTDIWAFGCVLFEMLTGSPAFARATLPDTIAAIVGSDPDWTKLPEATPAAIKRLLSRCLQKEPRRRLHDVADARIEVEEALTSPVEAAPGLDAVTNTRRWRRAIAVIGAMLVVAVALAAMRWGPLERSAAPSNLGSDARITRLTDLPGLEESPAISPDGRSVAFSAWVGARRQIFVQLVAGGSPLPVTRDAVDQHSPRWSSDSSSILYFSTAASGASQGDIWEVSALGGAPRRIVSSLGGADVRHPDGRLALFRLAKSGVQLVTAASNGTEFDVVADLPAVTYYLYPRWSPDGRWIAYQRGDSIRFDIFVVSSEGGDPRQLTHDNAMMGGFSWLPDSTGIVYSSSRGGTMPYLPSMRLWHIALADGRVRQVTTGESSYLHPDISRTGSVLAGRRILQSDIWKFPVDGAAADNVRRGVRLTRQTGQVLTPTAGPGDTEVAFLSDSGGHANLWIVNTESGALRQVTQERDPNVAVGVPVWSPTSSTIAFVYSRGNQGLTFGVWLVDSDGSNLRNIANPGLGPAWSSDGQFVYYATRGGPTDADVQLKRVPTDGGSAITVTTEPLRNTIGSDGTTLYYTFERPLVDGTPEFEIRAATPEGGPFRVLARIPASRVPIWQIVNPALSPDGQWLAQALTDGFTTNIWALSTSTGEWRQLTDFGDRPTFIARRVSWSSDGRSILAAVSEGDSDIVMLEGLVGPNRPVAQD